MQKKGYFPLFLVLLVISILLLAFWATGLLNIPVSFVAQVFSPIRRAEVSGLNQQKISDEVTLARKLIDQRKLEEDNVALRGQFAVTNPSPSNLLPASVVGIPGFIPGNGIPDAFIIDRGSRDGIKKGSAVVVENNLIGTVSDLSLSQSKITLLTDKSISITGKLESGASGVIRGTGDRIQFGNVLLSENVEKGSLVLTKGDVDLNGVGVPPDLVIGKVLSVEKKSSDLFQTADVSSLIDFSKLSTVFVILK